MTDERQSDIAPRDRRIRDAVRSMNEVRSDPAFRERLKRQFVDGSISAPHGESEPRKLPRWGWVLVPAAAAILLLVVFVPSPAPTWIVHGVRGQGSAEIGGRILSSDESALLARAIGSGGRVRVDEGLALELVLDDRLLLELDEQADVSVPLPPERESRSLLSAEVHAGELRIRTGPGFSGRDLHVLTAEGRTEIVGTVVSVYKGDDFTCVCVLEGTARIGADPSRLEEVPSGKRMVMFGDGRPPLVTQIEPQHAAGLLEFVDRHRDTFRRQW